MYTQGLIDICKQIVNERSKNTLFLHPLAESGKDEIYQATSSFPDSISYTKRIQAIAASNECKCIQCGKIHGDYKKANFCSQICYKAHRLANKPDKKTYEKARNCRIREEKFKDKIEGIDYLVCQICGVKLGDIGTHIIAHNMTIDDYKKKFNVKYTKPDKNREDRMGENNPAYNHGGKYSAWSKNFIYGYSEERHEEYKKNHSKFVRENRELFMTNIDYWLVQTNGDVKEAERLYKKFQTRNLDWFIEKYGEEEGIKRHAAKTEKWIKSFKKANFSKISQDLFNELAKYIDCADVYYATYDREEMTDYKNKEFILKVGNTYIRPDFIKLNTSKIIEFDGEYWHSANIANPTREARRDKLIISEGYQVLHVKEYDYKTDKEKVIQECLNFLKE